MTDLVPILAAVVPGAAAGRRARRCCSRARRAQADRLQPRPSRRRPPARPCARGGRARARRRRRAARPLVPGRRRERGLPRGDRGRRPVQRARLAGLPAHERAQLVQRARARAASTTRRCYVFWAALLAVPIVGNLGARLADGRGDDRRLGAAGRLQRPPRRARGRLEVPRADDARAVGRAARDRRARDRPGRRAAQHGLHALDWHALAGRRRRAAATRRRWSRSC